MLGLLAWGRQILAPPAETNQPCREIRALCRADLWPALLSSVVWANELDRAVISGLVSLKDRQVSAGLCGCIVGRQIQAPLPVQPALPQEGEERLIPILQVAGITPMRDGLD